MMRRAAGRLARADALSFRLLPAPARRDRDQRAAAASALGEAAAAQSASVRHGAWVCTLVPNHSLNPAQARALDRMASALGSFSAFLLHGVTGSGKTEVYLHLIARVLARGGQALILVPEIGLTPQLEAVFRQAFPETRLALLHSGLEDVARTGSWLDAARGDAGIVLGTRLAVLAPLAETGAGRGRRGARHLVQAAGRLALLCARRRGVPGEARRLPGDPRYRNTIARDLAQLAIGRYERLELAERAVPGARLPAFAPSTCGRPLCSKVWRLPCWPQ